MGDKWKKMTIKNKIRNTITTGTLLLGSLFGGQVLAEEAKPVSTEALCSTRLRSETNINQQDSHKFTFELADCKEGKHGDEYFRLYNFTDPDYTALGFKLPSLKFGELESIVTAFGTFGDKKGIGIEAINNFDKYTLTLNAETGDATRLGAGLDYKLSDKWTIGAAFDTVNNGERTNQQLAKIIYDASKTDQFGAGYVLSETEGDKTNSLGAFWCHYNDSWGTRTRVKYDFGDNQRKVGFDSIIAQNPTFSAGSSPWIVGRNIGDMYNLSVVENALAPERVPLGDRTKGGLVGEVQGSFDLENDSEWIRGDLGYRFQRDNWDVTPIVFGKYDSVNSDSVGASVLLHPKKVLGGNICIEATYTHPLESGDDDLYLGIQFSCPIGAQKKH